MKERLILLLANPRNIGHLCDIIGTMPNIKTGTKGGEVFWSTLASHGGWRIQQNLFTRHCRLLDPFNNRIAWGSESAMMSALKQVTTSY